MRGGKTQGRRAADGIAKKDCTFDVERVHRAQQQACVVCGIGCASVVRRAALSRPVERNDLEAVADALCEGLEIARAMSDGVQTEDGIALAAPHDGQARSVDIDPGSGFGGADGAAQCLFGYMHVHGTAPAAMKASAPASARSLAKEVRSARSAKLR